MKIHFQEPAVKDAYVVYCGVFWTSKRRSADWKSVTCGRCKRIRNRREAKEDLKP